MSAPTLEDVKAMQAIGGGLDEILNGKQRPKPNGFVLLVFSSDGKLGERTNYVSNCARADMIVALKEVLARFEGQPEISGRA
ncbi:hypothetical protein G6L32_07970 [Agrobacterium tumefaciens]|uniref:hypothetical protein n=1 Tax=Agrobacterium tumefaciens TaxID=358 RepID=UPI0015719F9E|nr:hypothetical protein [Agrobacterium tumefaciens]